MSKTKKKRARQAEKKEQFGPYLPNPNKRPVTVVYSAVPVVIPPRLYQPIEALCKDALLYSGNHTGMRKAISGLIFAMRAHAEEQAGHVTADILVLEALLQRTDPRQGELPMREVQKDPILEYRRQNWIDQDQVNAADFIKRIWAGWGRHLAVAARSYDSGSGGGAHELRNPLSAMGDDLIDAWEFVYTPWYENAKQRLVFRSNGDKVRHTSIVLGVVLEGIFPGTYDQVERLEKGTSKTVLIAELANLATALERAGGQSNGSGKGG